MTVFEGSVGFCRWDQMGGRLEKARNLRRVGRRNVVRATASRRGTASVALVGHLLGDDCWYHHSALAIGGSCDAGSRS